ncbi:tRNA modification GTPase MnmE [Methylopila jiangsuensis]|uniref:tRNA modification GTPase MnmE n=1 Tax=Methylopila jiangsuensis TaxID=586230 RepID=A0A9W6JKW9_9HYPH|nr:tRNA uridine-5-carboxymethylaminomethyl(34) synthesis GTPase MnmE [Methylopila jiangsuensis]MDR6285217.1 tRNA modification GTPase [Methylopila jiangsuensis]GLK77393.1 tRNA modification GTPase MnmE [Methylopila jiangsuensis]
MTDAGAPSPSAFNAALRRDSIVAVSTAPGRAAIAVIRLSGPETGAALDALAGARPAPRRASLRRIRDPRDGETLDRGLALWLPGPGSPTGEDCAELHIHGGRAVVAAVLDAALSLPGVRAAEPGEFARRAFLAGRLDLAEAEGLADLIDAETEGQRRQALRQSEGALSARAQQWRDRMIGAMALIEAGIDFVDEDDVPAEARAQSYGPVAALAEDLRAALADQRAERLRDGFHVAIVGRPNAGKSSLLNSLLREDVAIVADTPGTTRDVLEARLDLGGYPVVLADTAGLREAEDAVEREGVRRARRRAAEADLTLWLRDASAPDEDESAPESGGALWRIASKTDLAPAPADADLALSTRTGAGLDALLAALTEAVQDGLGGTEHAGLTRARHREVVAAALDDLDAALGRWAHLPDEVLAELLRRAAGAIGRIVGGVDVEDVLDRLFSSFCIGK